MKVVKPATRLSRVLLAAVLATAGAHAQAAPPSLVSKILRSFGLQATPGNQGNKAYKKGDYGEALRKYEQSAGEGETSPALDFNKGNALYKQKRYGEAAEAYGQALKRAGTDSAFAARAHYNLGNAHYGKAAAADSTATDAAISDLRESLAHYKRALQSDSKNRDAKQNLEQAQSLLQRLLAKQEQQKQNQPQKQPEPSARAKEALARALQLAQQRRYPEAMNVLNDILRADPTAAPYKAHLQRLDDIVKILSGRDPTPPAGPQDPRMRQKGMGI